MLLETYGAYQLVEKLAVGGMAQLFLARRRSKGQDRTVVLKRILPHLAEDTAFVTMFLDEARIAARLHHPNVIEILDLGAEGDSYFIAMEYVHGEDLRRISKRGVELGRRMPPPMVCRVVAQACRGLDYAHRRTDAQGKPLCIVHRDVSPQNILVGFDGQVKVVDFGIAKAADKATVTASGVIKGKHAYMSPEQALGRDIDHRTDVFALGIVLFEALTATRLFRRATDLQTLKAVSECRVEPPSKVFAGVPTQLDGIILKALTKDLTVRYQHAEELADALEDWLGDRPDGSPEAVGQYVSELFADRLEKEQREGKYVPTRSAIDFGSVSRSGPSKGGATASLRFEKRSVTEMNDAQRPSLALGSPLESRATDVTPAFTPPGASIASERNTDSMPGVQRSATEISKPELERMPERPARSSRPVLDQVPDRPARSSRPVLDPVPDEPKTVSGIKTAAQLGESGGTTPYGRPLATDALTEPLPPRPIDPLQMKTLIETSHRVATPLPAKTPHPAYDDAPVTEAVRPSLKLDAVTMSGSPEDTARARPALKKPAMWPWWLAAGITTVAVGAVVGKVLVDRHALIKQVEPVVKPAPAPAPQTGTPEKTTTTTTIAPPALQQPVPEEPLAPDQKPQEHGQMRPFGSVPVTGPVWAMVRREGKLFGQSAASALKVGDTLRVIGPAKGGTKERDFFGVASVVELREGDARVLFEDPDALPDGLFVTSEDGASDHVEHVDAKPKPPVQPRAEAGLVGSVQLKRDEPGADVALKNATDFAWTQCEVRLPDNRGLKFGERVVIKAGGTQWVTGSAFKQRRDSVDPKQREGFAQVKCAEGDGWLKVAYLP